MLLKIAHVEDAHDPRYLVLQEPGSYTIGFDSGNDIMLADSTVADRHARLTLEAGVIVVAPLNSCSLLVDEQPIRGPTEVELAQWIQLGETVLQVLRGDQAPQRNYHEHRPPSAEEQGFLATLRGHPADDETRLVYADWLEAAECPITATYIRLELANTVDIGTSPLVERATLITQPEWRAIICRGAIGNCDHRACPNRWHALVPTAKPFTRTCTTCADPVHYCADRAIVALHGEQRARIVLDASLRAGWAAEAYHFGLYRDHDDHRTPPALFRGFDPEQTYDRGLDTEIDDDDPF